MGEKNLAQHFEWWNSLVYVYMIERKVIFYPLQKCF